MSRCASGAERDCSELPPKGFSPNSRPPSPSLSQNVHYVLVPFLGIRQPSQDTFDEAVTITTPVARPCQLLHRQLQNFCATAFVVDRDTYTGPKAKKAKTGVAATTAEADAASSQKLTSFFASNPNPARATELRYEMPDFPVYVSWGDQFQNCV